jgi:hypothetical protein
MGDCQIRTNQKEEKHKEQRAWGQKLRHKWQRDGFRSFLKAGAQNLFDPGYQGADFFFWGIPLFRIEAGIREGDQPLDADPGGMFVGLEFVERIIHFLRGKQFFIDSYIPLSAHPLQIVFEDGSGQNARWDELSHSEKFLSLIECSSVKFLLEWIF